MSNIDSLEKLKIKRKYVRTAFTKLKTKIDLFMQSSIENESDNLEKLSEYLLNLEEKGTELKTLNEKIEDLITDAAAFQTETEGSIEYDESISDLKCKIKSKLKKFKIENTVPEPDQSANVSNFSNNRNSSTSINLPKLCIPTFNGDSSTFLEFFNSFTSAIDANQSLSN
jgi:hypothetical protein